MEPREWKQVNSDLYRHMNPQRATHTAVRPRSLVASAMLMILTIAAGLTIRFVHFGQPASVSKFGGSALWAAMIYWVLSTLLPSWPPRAIVLFSGLAGTGVEFLKLYNPPWLDALRSTLAGILLLGRIFNPWDIAVYWLAIVAAAALDLRLRRSI